MEEREVTLGVDFGTSNTTVFYWDKGKVESIQINKDKTLLPSAISYGKDGNYDCGSKAVNSAIKSPLHVRSVKRVLGCDYSSLNGKDLANGLYGCQLVEGQNNSCVFVNPKSDGSIRKTPVEVVTDIFKYIKKAAEEKTTRTFSNITLSFPTTFRVNQKAALREAARNAGFTIKGMITEPTAAGVHYRMKNDIKNRDVVLVFDFGGGTLDLSLMLYENDSFRVFANGGNSHLGGNDIDQRILEYVEECYQRITDEKLFDDSLDDRMKIKQKRKLLEEIETEKCVLQNKEERSVEISIGCVKPDAEDILLTEDEFEKRIDGDLTLARNCLERLSRQLIRNYKGKVIGRHRVTNNPNALQMIVDSVIMVGGSSNLKAVQKLLKAYFSPDIVHIHSDIQECVGSGAFHTFLSIVDPKQHVREVLGHSIIVHINNDVKQINSDITYPFEVTYTFTPSIDDDPFCSTIDLKIEKDMTMEDEATVCTVFNKKLDYKKTLKNLKSPTFGVMLCVGLDCVLQVYLHDYWHRDRVLIGECDIWSVC